MLRAKPETDSLTEPFWAAASRRELVVQRCQACRRRQHPPRPACAACGAADVGFEPVSGGGTVLTWTEVRQPFVSSWRDELPFTCFLVELDEQAGLVFAADDVHFFRRLGKAFSPSAGLAVRVEFEPIDGGLLLPQFVPAGVSL
jgi:uncharacterized OB-fold protein